MSEYKMLPERKGESPTTHILVVPPDYLDVFADRFTASISIGYIYGYEWAFDAGVSRPEFRLKQLGPEMTDSPLPFSAVPTEERYTKNVAGGRVMLYRLDKITTTHQILWFDTLEEAKSIAIEIMNSLSEGLPSGAWVPHENGTIIEYCDSRGSGMARVYVRLYCREREIDTCQHCERPAAYDSRAGYYCDKHVHLYPA